jgi:hypothetical protein
MEQWIIGVMEYWLQNGQLLRYLMVSGVRFQAKGSGRKGLNRRTMEQRTAEYRITNVEG